MQVTKPRAAAELKEMRACVLAQYRRGEIRSSEARRLLKEYDERIREAERRERKKR